MADDTLKAQSLSNAFTREEQASNTQQFLEYLDRSIPALISDMFFAATIDLATNDYGLPAHLLAEKHDLYATILEQWAKGKELPDISERGDILTDISIILHEIIGTEPAPKATSLAPHNH